MKPLSQKAQGLTEYGIILLLVVSLGLGVYTSFNLKGNISSLYNQISAQLIELLGYDTGETLNITYKSNEKKKITVTLHKTRLIWNGAPLYWYMNTDSKNKTTKLYTNNTNPPGGSNGNLFTSSINGFTSETIYFKTDNGAYYSLSADGSQLALYTGDTSFMGSANLGVKP